MIAVSGPSALQTLRTKFNMQIMSIFYFSSGIFMCALGRKRPNLTMYERQLIYPIQDLLQGKALISWYVHSDDFKVCGLKITSFFEKLLLFGSR